jgi:hypothetical protein
MFKQRASQQQQQQQRPSAQRPSSSTAATPFCKMCKDAGKKDYAHYLHDPKTKKTTCPYLLTIVCGYCKQQEGHTTKYCPKLKTTKTQALEVQQAPAAPAQSPAAPEQAPTKKQNRYALFAQHLEEEEAKEKQKEQNAIAVEKAEIEKAKLAEKVAANYTNDFPGLPSPKVKRVSKEKRVSFDSNCKSEPIVAKPSQKSTSSYSNSAEVEKEDWSWRPSENDKSWGF